MKRQRFTVDDKDDFAFGIEKLIKLGVFSDAYPIHDGTVKEKGKQKKYLPFSFTSNFLDCKRSKLSKEWGSWSKWYKYQPLDAVRKYFGVKIGLYFAWLGFFTTMLIFPSIAGVIVFCYGLVITGEDKPSYDICEGAMKDEMMCPICDPCDFWKLEVTYILCLILIVDLKITFRRPVI